MLYQTLSTPNNGREVVAPRLFIARDALDKLLAYVNLQLRHAEITGWAYVRPHGSDFYLKTSADVFITKQIVTTSTADGDGHSLAHAFEKAARDDRDNELRLQWHSHPAEAYFSHTDHANIEHLGETFDWLISLVMNRDGDMHARFDCFQPFRVGVEMAVVRYTPLDPAVAAEVSADITRDVTVQEPLKPRPSKK